MMMTVEWRVIGMVGVFLLEAILGYFYMTFKSLQLVSSFFIGKL